MIRHFQIIIRIQAPHSGIRFRTYSNARKLGIVGSVSEESGQITIDAEGEEVKLDKLINYCKQLYACDSRVMEIKEKPVEFYTAFRIL